MRSRISVVCLVVTAVFVSAGFTGGGQASAAQKNENRGGKPPKPSTNDYLQITINDVLAGTARIISDGLGSGPLGVDTYTDRRIPDHGEPCVTARFVNNGGTWSHFNRGSSSTESDLLNDCADNVVPGGITARTYVLEFVYDPNYDPDQGGPGCPCYELQLADPDADGFCTLAVDADNLGVPRISTSSLFKRKDKTATIDLMFRHEVDPGQGGPESFVISSNNPLNIGGNDPFVYLQTRPGGEDFRLNSPASEVQCDAFPLSLSINFKKVSVTTGG